MRAYEGSIAYRVIDQTPMSVQTDSKDSATAMLQYRERQILALRNSHLALEEKLEKLQAVVDACDEYAEQVA